MADWLDNLHPSLRPLWDLENELRKAAQNAIFLKNDEAKLHLAEARKHYDTALKALMGEVPAKGTTATLRSSRRRHPRRRVRPNR